MNLRVAEPKGGPAAAAKRGSEMGEVRVKVKLTNATDAMLALRGRIASSEVRSYVADALVDTGAARSTIPVQIVDRLGIQTRGRRVAEYADGRKEIVPMTEPVVIEIAGRDTTDEALILGDEVLIGQTVLEKIDVLVDYTNRRLVPNPAHPDQAVSKIK